MTRAGQYQATPNDVRIRSHPAAAADAPQVSFALHQQVGLPLPFKW